MLLNGLKRVLTTTLELLLIGLTQKRTAVIKSAIIVSEWVILRVTADLQKEIIATETLDQGHHQDVVGQTHVIETTDVGLL